MWYQKKHLEPFKMYQKVKPLQIQGNASMLNVDNVLLKPPFEKNMVPTLSDTEKLNIITKSVKGMFNLFCGVTLPTVIKVANKVIAVLHTLLHVWQGWTFDVQQGNLIWLEVDWGQPSCLWPCNGNNLLDHPPPLRARRVFGVRGVGLANGH